MNNDDFNPKHTPPIPPELEVRIVAWALGEASAFEAAELERLCEERPELAVFKRRIEAVHGLAGEAVKPPRDVLRLSPERRATLLAAIGGGQREAGVSVAKEQRASAKSAKRSGVSGRSSKRLAWREWALPMAACLTLVFSLAVVMIPKRAGEQILTKRKVFEAAPNGPVASAQDELKQVEHRLQANRKGGGTARSEESTSELAISFPERSFRTVSDEAYRQSRESIPDSDREVGDVFDTQAGAFSPPAPIAAPTKPESTISITVRTPQEFTTRGSTDNLLDGDRWRVSFDPFSAQVVADTESFDHFKAAATEDRLRRKNKDSFSTSAADHFAPPMIGASSVSVDGRKRFADYAGERAGAAENENNYVLSAPVSRPTDVLRHKLNSIIIPEAKFDGVEFSRVLSALSAVSAEYDKDERAPGANLVLLDPSNRNPIITITTRDLSLGRILDLITEQAGYRYEIESDAVVVRPQREAAELDYQFFPVERSTLERMIGKDVPPVGESKALRKFMQAAGVDFDGIAGSDLVYDGAAVIVSQTPRNMERVRNVLDRYESIREKPKAPDLDAQLRAELSTATEAVSTFSLHVSDASFLLAKAALERGEKPDPASVRPEEFYNAFDYGDPAPVTGEPVACRVEQAAHPFLQQRNLVRIAMRVPAIGRGAGQPLRLTVLLDTSGSMEREDRAATVHAALVSLVSLLGPDDRVSLVGFARTPRLLAESVPGDQATKLVDLAARTPAEGGTNLEEALQLAGELAMRQRLAGAQNRIVLLTDGAANLGNADPEALSKQVELLRQTGIAFDACGVVADGLDDTVLEALTRKGDGRYTLINSPEDADATFARQLAGAFRPAAKDVKVQVRFNPARVSRYRLIGFEQHRLKTEDFRNDAVDAAELASEEAAVALYQVEVLPEGEGELGEVFVRFLDTATDRRVERSWTLAHVAQPPAFARATPSMQLAGSAAFLAEELRGGALAGQIRLDEFAPVVDGLAVHYPHAARVQEFITMFRQARRLTGE